MLIKVLSESGQLLAVVNVLSWVSAPELDWRLGCVCGLVKGLEV